MTALNEKELTPRELVVMQVFWRDGEMTAEVARGALAKGGERLSYPTVANVVRALSDKGFLQATNTERPFCYRPVRTFEEVSKRIVREVIARVFDGSREAMLVNLLDRRKLTRREKAFLTELLQQQGD